MVVVGVTAVALLIGGAAGLALGTPSPRIPGDLGSPPELDHPPALPADFPDTSLRYLPGVTVDGIVAALGDVGWACEAAPAYLAELGGEHRQECQESEFGGRVIVDYDSDSEVRLVSVLRCYWQEEDPAGDCRDPFQLVTAAVFNGQPADVRDQAATWVDQHASSAAITYLGGMELSIEALELQSAHEYTMRIAPEGLSRSIRCRHPGEPGCS